MSDLTVTPTVELLNEPPRIRLDVQDANLPARFAATVVRHNPDGTTSPVRTTRGGPLTLTTSGAVRTGVVYDYEAPFGEPVSYSTAESPGVSSGEVTVDSDRAWLIHPGVPELSRPVVVAEFGTRSRAAQRTLHRPMGRKTPLPYTDGQRKAPEYLITLRTDTESEALSLEALLDDTTTLLFNVPAALGWGIRAEYVSVGDLDETRILEYAPDPHRYWPTTFTVVARPAGGTQAERTLLDLLVFPTLADVQAAYPSLAALLAGP